MNADHVPYVALAVCVAVVVGLAAVMMVGNAWLGPKRRSKIKGEPFECGGPPVDDPRRRFSVKFYMVGILFIVFDIEAVFLIPWAVLYRDFLSEGAFALLAMVEMFVFIGVLALALWYVWRRGALDWD